MNVKLAVIGCGKCQYIGYLYGLIYVFLHLCCISHLYLLTMRVCASVMLTPCAVLLRSYEIGRQAIFWCGNNESTERLCVV